MRYHYTYIGKVKYKNLTKHLPAKMRNNRNSHLLLAGLQNGRVTLEAISYRAKYCHITITLLVSSNNYTNNYTLTITLLVSSPDDLIGYAHIKTYT